MEHIAVRQVELALCPVDNALFYFGFPFVFGFSQCKEKGGVVYYATYL
jgi:hypothetical protein